MPQLDPALELLLLLLLLAKSKIASSQGLFLVHDKLSQGFRKLSYYRQTNIQYTHRHQTDATDNITTRVS